MNNRKTSEVKYEIHFHKSRLGWLPLTLTCLFNVNTLPWPAASPDLNPIENLWSHLKQRIRKRITARTTLQDVGRIAVEEWQGIPMQRIHNLIGSMRTRYEEVVHNRGAYNHY